ncbi:MAG TPA: STAS domain-containing protein [Rhodocyclaceae bacterium]
MDVQQTTQHNVVTLALSGVFKFDTHREFRAACSGTLEQPGIEHIIVDLSQVTYMDSAALGMLLILRDKAQSRGTRVSLARATNNVRQCIEVSRFDRLFEVLH